MLCWAEKKSLLAPGRVIYPSQESLELSFFDKFARIGSWQSRFGLKKAKNTERWDWTLISRSCGSKEVFPPCHSQHRIYFLDYYFRCNKIIPGLPLQFTVVDVKIKDFSRALKDLFCQMLYTFFSKLGSTIHIKHLFLDWNQAYRSHSFCFQCCLIKIILTNSLCLLVLKIKNVIFLPIPGFLTATTQIGRFKGPGIFSQFQDWLSSFFKDRGYPVMYAYTHVQHIHIPPLN